MKKRFYYVLALVVAALAVWVGVKYFLDAREAAKPKSYQADRLAVAVAMPERRDLVDVRTFTGTLKADSSYDVSPKVAGKLVELPWELGDAVKPNDLVARLDDIEYVLELAQAKANLETGRAQLTEAEINLRQAERDFERYAQLHSSKVYSDAQFESVQTALNSQKAILEMRKAELAKLQAVADNAQTRLDDTVISANWGDHPRFVATKYVDAGTLLAVNQPILNIIDIAKLKAEVNVIERDYPKLKLHHPAKITTDAYPDRVFEGEISNIAQSLQETSRQASVLIGIPNGDFALKPGMFARVEIEFERRPNTLTVPLEAVVKRNNTVGVFVYHSREGKVSFVPVEVGLTVDNFVDDVEMYANMHAYTST